MWKVKNNFGFEESESVANNIFLNEYYNNIYNVHELQSQQSTYTNKSDNAYIVYDSDKIIKISDILSIAQAKMYFMDINNGCYREIDSSSDFQIDAIEKTITIITDEIGTETVQSFDIIGLNDFKNDINFEGMDGSGFAIAVLDTGIDLNHSFFGPDENNDGISDRIVYSYDFTDEGDNTADDTDGHGTSVSSIAASSDTQYAGVASGVDIVALQVVKADGSASFDAMENALQWLIENAIEYNIIAVNMSIGWWWSNADYTTVLSDELAILKNMGIMVVLAAGNSYYYYQEEGISVLAADPSVISVGAVYDANVGIVSYANGAIDYTTDENRITSFSARSETMVDIFAPGALITAAGVDGGLHTGAGTSYATPFITGLVAVAQEIAMRDLGRLLTQDEFLYLLQSTGKTIIDGDDEDDNVVNTGKEYKEVDAYALAQAIGSLDDWASGTSGDDVLNGTSDNDKLNGKEGNDIIEGGLGDDTLIGGYGIDTLSYASSESSININLALTIQQDTIGSGVDTIFGFENLTGSNYDDILKGNALNNVILAGLGNDILEGGLGDDTLNGSTGIDTVIYENSYYGVAVNLALTAAQTIQGTEKDTIIGVENLIGSNYNDTLIGNSLNNVLEGGLGNDILNGSTGIDTVTYESSTAGVVVNLSKTIAQDTIGAGTDTLTNFENLTGSNHDDILTGNSSANTINGNGGNDIIDGGAGNDILNGGDGSDTLSYETATTAIKISLSSTIAQATGGSGSDTISNFENLTGSKYNDTLTGNDNNNTILGGLGNDIIEGGLGNDTLIGGDGIDTLSYALSSSSVIVDLSNEDAQDTIGVGTDTITGFENITGSNYDDTFKGNTLNNIILAGLGNDILNGGLGNDTLNGGIGIDTATYESSTVGVTVNLALTTAQTIQGTEKDTITGVENLTGSNYNDILKGSTLSNTINGLDGNDTIVAGTGKTNDIFDGGNGVDTISYEQATSLVTIDLLNTSFQVTTGSGSDTLTNFENLTGSNYNDTLMGDDSNNTIIGGAGNDTINGNGGNDIIDGGAGNDILNGGGGEDAFVFNVAYTIGNQDTISDFNYIEDKIYLDNSIFISLGLEGILNPEFFKDITPVNGETVYRDSNDYLLYNRDNGGLFYDSDGYGGRYGAQPVAYFDAFDGLYPIINASCFIVA